MDFVITNHAHKSVTTFTPFYLISRIARIA